MEQTPEEVHKSPNIQHAEVAALVNAGDWLSPAFRRTPGVSGAGRPAVRGEQRIEWDL